jgi:hypothetical protein
MNQRIAVETLTLSEVADLFQKSVETAHPKFDGALERMKKKIRKNKISNYRWIKSYEEFKGAKLTFYSQFLPKGKGPIVSIGMTHRTTRGLILITFDLSNGCIPVSQKTINTGRKWVRIFTGHFCERYAERIMSSEKPTFQLGSEELMFSDLLGPVRVTDKISEGLEEIEFQFKKGQAYGYRDAGSRITFFKTVYSNDMLKGDRKLFREDWKEVVDQLQELFKWNSSK